MSLIRLLYLLLACTLTAPLYAQSGDSAKVAYSQEECRLTTEEVKRFICYVTRANVEEKTLIKLGFWPTSDRSPNDQVSLKNFSAGVNAELAIERKLSPAFSVLAGFDALWRYTSYPKPIVDPSFYAGSNPDVFYFNLRTRVIDVNWKAGVRYYHAMPGQIKKGKSANNFSGNYLTLQLAEPFKSYNRYQYYNPVLNKERETRSTTKGYSIKYPRLALAYGIQRRIGALGYVDINAGPEVQFFYGKRRIFSVQLNAQIGLGW